MAALGSHLRAIAQYNVRTLRESPLAELSGSLGDLGTLLPLMFALALKGSIDLPATLVFSGLTNIFTGALYGIPLPVQPMKAIAAVAISQSFDKQETMAAGLTMGIAVFVLSATGLLRWLNRVVPVPVVKGIQVGAGLSLAISAGTSLIMPLHWALPAWDNRVWAIAAFFLLVIAALVPRLPYALIVFTVGLIMAAVLHSTSSQEGTRAGIWHPSTVVPDGHAWRIGAIDAAIPQLPLTTLNSILAVCSLSASLFPSYPPTPSTTSVGFSVSIANLIGCWFGAMPVCHGSGGLAGQYRFGARSGSSIIILGLVKLVLGLFVGEAIVPLLQQFPKSLLGIMVFAAGVELAKVGQSVSESRDLWERAEDDNNDGRTADKANSELEQERRDRWMVMLITAAGCLAFKNDAVGFLAGLIWHWSLRIPRWLEGRKLGHIRIGHERRTEEGSNLLDVNHDGPEGRID
ncbi:molybdate transporter 2-like [Teratosphaeria destructans]|uniref:Molybdate transporter 2-like n=1 Tax=Teratosphaeria destructans TaxID=418781 RepID=A0A9W7SWB6_9PEZI|nr:molybdate transporter 2-like [Teratosphaeria destructans]